jgi:hypothetical protein
VAKLAEETQEPADKDDTSDDKAEATTQEGDEDVKVVESNGEKEEEEDLEVEEEERGYCEDENVELDPFPAESRPVSVNFGEDGEPEDDEGKESKSTREQRIANLVEESRRIPTTRRHGKSLGQQRQWSGI